MKRREFLSLGAGAPLLARALQSGPEFDLACSAITWGTKGFEKAIGDISAAGYRGLQYRYPQYDQYKDRPNEFRELLAKHKLKPVAISSGSVDLRPEERQKQMDRTVAHAKFHKQIGGLYVQLLDDVSRRNPGLPDAHRKLGEFLNDLGRRVADEGLRLGYHNHLGALGEGREAMGRIFDALDPAI